jgi:hydrogenase maturation protease
VYLLRNTFCEDRMDIESPILLIGVGNEYRSDDGLGILAAREILRRHLPGVRVVEQSGEGTRLMETWEGYSCVLIVDAICSGKAHGDVHRIDAASMSVPKGFFHYSSHSFGVAEAIEMARELGRLPEVLMLHGVEGNQYEPGVGLTDLVVRSMPELLAAIETDILSLREHHHVA